MLNLAGFLLHNKIYTLTFDSVYHILDTDMNMVKGLIEFENNKINLELTEFLFGKYKIKKSGRYYKVIIGEKQTIISPSLVNKDFVFKVGEIINENKNNSYLIYKSVGWNNEDLIVSETHYTFHKTKIDIYVAENIDKELNLIKKLDCYIFILFLFFFLISAFVATVLINLSLKAIKDFENQVNMINHTNLNTKIDSINSVIELRGLSESFNEMLERLKKAFETERVIISETSHKLKTPVAVIISSCEISLQRLREKDEYIDTINTIKNYGYKLSKLISDILSLAHLDSGKIKQNSFERISLAESLNIIIEIVEYIAKEKNIDITLSYSEDVFIYADKDRLIEALLSIVENAIKYNKVNGYIEITFNKHQNYVAINITDSGIGISEPDLKNIFQRFYRSNDVSQIEGSGLGLSIAKTIVESHNGKIDVQSKKDKETTFSVFLPLLNISSTKKLNEKRT